MGLSLCFFALFVHLFSSFLLSHAVFAHFNSSIHPIYRENERSALLEFKHSLIVNQSASGDPTAYSKVASWRPDKETSNCCFWDGIKCDQDTGHVIKLDLTSSFLYGPINSSSSLFHLVHLRWLSLADNDFKLSNIPTRIINLTRLSHLDLSYSAFSGQIPSEILELSKLEYLDVSQPNLELQNPSLTNLLEKLINLNVLGLNGVKIYSPIPPALTNLSSLTNLSLSECSLQGTIPSSIGNLKKLVYLDISNNSFQGTMPSSIGNLKKLVYLDISHNNFWGKLPSSIINFRSLSYLDVNYSFISGKFPPSLSNLTQLDYLDLSNNGFSGELPAFVGNLGSLNKLDISLCNFSGKVPASFGNLTKLSELAIWGNNFSGLNSYSLSWIANLKGLTTLELSYSNIIGEIPSAFMNLTQLTTLSVNNNQLTGPIPSWMMNLNKLSTLRFRFNQLSGHIPTEIRNLTQLQILIFASNQLEGAIPSSIFELKNLVRLGLHSNNLSGTVDLNLCLVNLKSLEMLVLSSNKLSILTKTTVKSNLPKFWVIGFGSCNLSEFPYFLHNQDQLEFLDLSSNKIAGQVPKWLFNATKSLVYLNLSSNLLTGFEHNLLVLPWTGLEIVDLRFNKLQGPPPIPAMSTYSYLVSNNQLTGQLLPWICSLNSLYALDLSYNNLSGMLPECLGNFSLPLSVLKLQGNNFRGVIPQTFINGTSLRMIDLSNNSLQGRIPKSLANCVKLKFLNLGNNQITDIFPSWLGNLPELEVLILKFNSFYGVVKQPETCFEFTNLRIIDLSQNRFTGNLPSKYFQCWNAMKNTNTSKLTYLQDSLVPYLPYSLAPLSQIFTLYGYSDYSLILSNKGTEMEYEKLSNLITAIILSNNDFVGEIPTSIGNLKGLRTLNLSNNNLEGHIPASLENLTVLESLDLSNNKLSGEIPQQLAGLTALSVFDVSHNHLTGPIPRGTQFSTFIPSSFDGNPGLCGEPLAKKCENSGPSPVEDPRSGSLFAFGWKIVLIGYASGTIIGVVVGHIFSTRKREWLAKTFRLPLKTNDRRKRN